MKVRKLLLPFSWLYGLITSVRNYFYDKGLFKSVEFNIPVICVGNLNTGGTGKTPHVEYIVELLRNKYLVATLSRGYGRKSKGFLLTEADMSAELTGDEPLQFAMKYHDIKAAVGENRVEAIKEIVAKFPDLKTIIMDDGFQHRAVNPGLSVLLTDYSKLFINDYLLPAGNLRESKEGYKRANLIIVTKCPNMSNDERKNIIHGISPLQGQQVLFSRLRYNDPVSFKTGMNPIKLIELNNYDVLLLTGIANPESIIDFLKDKVKGVHPFSFPDHRLYTRSDLKQVEEKFNNIANRQKIILTTEKDFMKLKGKETVDLTENLPYYYIPVKVEFDESDKKIMDKKILSYVGKN
jgi:tetraacyldisaccharide 4'-kinase